MTFNEFVDNVSDTTYLVYYQDDNGMHFINVDADMSEDEGPFTTEISKAAVCDTRVVAEVGAYIVESIYSKDAHIAAINMVVTQVH